MTDFRVLGPVQVVRDGDALRVGGGNPRSVLALLVVHRGAVVPMASLIDALWGDLMPADPIGSVRVIVSGLRRALGATDSEAVQTVPPGYLLALPDEATDLGRFRQARDRGRSAASARRFADAAQHFRAALVEWRGPALADLRGMRFADDIAAALDEERLLATESRIDADLGVGENPDLAGELAALTAQHPLRENLWALCMTVLYRTGRQADALAAYRTLRTTLLDELGVEPSAPLRDLHEAILRQDHGLVHAPHGLAPAPVLSETISEAAVPDAWLVGQSGERIRLEHGRLRLGRSAENSLVLDDPKVSRAHAAITHSVAGFAVIDLGSTNGTRVNGQDVESHLLCDGDRIRLGDAEFTFHVAAPPIARPPRNAGGLPSHSPADG